MLKQFVTLICLFVGCASRPSVPNESAPVASVSKPDASLPFVQPAVTDQVYRSRNWEIKVPGGWSRTVSGDSELTLINQDESVGAAVFRYPFEGNLADFTI